MPHRRVKPIQWTNQEQQMSDPLGRLRPGGSLGKIPTSWRAVGYVKRENRQAKDGVAALDDRRQVGGM
jgi:hypothetical protein